MRRLAIFGAVLAPVLAVAGCNENTGWNPNYSAMHNGSPYAAYLQKREVALDGKGAVPQVIPIQLPARAPTAAEIAGTAPTTVTATGAPTAQARTGTTGSMPVTTTGPYAGTTPVLVKYAHQERHNPGSNIYKRTGGPVAQSARLCSTYPSTDAAQRAFIANGGPLLDPRGMDPDGDGFVCGWDPQPFRQSNGL